MEYGVTSTCGKCGQEKEFYEGGWFADNSNQYGWVCRDCNSDYTRFRELPDLK